MGIKKYQKKINQLRELSHSQTSAAPAAAPTTPTSHEPRNLIVCCDGTSNEWGHQNTNVATLYAMLDKNPDARPQQIAFYDPGVGTLGDRAEITWAKRQFTKLLGLALARGITRNIEDAYIFLMDNYQPGDKVFLFGFSRGAYTVRALAGMLIRVGLLPKGNNNLVPYATKAYHGPTWKASLFKRGLAREDECIPFFVGVWDTVKSVGFFLPRSFPNAELNEKVQHGRHALSIDEKRGMFQPTPWEPAKSSQQCIKQAWFPGDHCDVGGGRGKDDDLGLSDGALRWMAEQAIDPQVGLRLNPEWRDKLHEDPKGKLHSSVFPNWFWFPFYRRFVPPNADLHKSVGLRQKAKPKYGRKIGQPVSIGEKLLGTIPCVLTLVVLGGFLAWFLPRLWALLGVVWSQIGNALGSLSELVSGNTLSFGVAAGLLVGLLIAGLRFFLHLWYSKKDSW